MGKIGKMKNLKLKISAQIKVIQSLYRPFEFQEVESPSISRQSTHEGGKVVSPTHGPPLLPRR
jgi:hypothetical protein